MTASTVTQAAPEQAFAALRQKAASYLPGADLALLDEAYRFAAEAHRHQTRASGEPYITHPLAVAAILADLELDLISLVAALLHDVVEDTGVTLDQVRDRFGQEVAELVDGVTKLRRLEFKSRLEEQAENLRKMLLAMARDIRVVLIRLADRLHNMRTLQYLPEEKRKRIARETLEIFAPLAHRLGIFRLQSELEDLALQHLDPEAYARLAEEVERQFHQREVRVQQLMAELRERLEQVGIRAEVQGRAKHLYSIYRKMTQQGRSLSEIYDLLAVRVIVDSVRDCYAALGVVHTLWKPIPGRFKDFIATPKSNMYQSLHTTVVGPGGEPFEIQIRTWEMHRTAEYGIAAHWRYKEGGKTDPELDKKLRWLREILEWQSDLKDAREFMESLKLNVFPDEVFVFTPKGDVIELPAGATPIDFAYRIHTEIGHRMVGARVNGRMVPIDTPLQNGDIVEILTSKTSPGPSVDWLNIVKTATARNRIRQFLKRQHRDVHLARGREMLERELRAAGLTPTEAWRDEVAQEVARSLGFKEPEDLLVALGSGGIAASQVMARLREVWRARGDGALRPGPGTLRSLPGAARPDAAEGEALLQRLTRSGNGRPAVPTGSVTIQGAGHVLVRFSRCCNPVPGDPIVGYVTRGRGVSIHRRDCTNLQALAQQDPSRLLEVSWDTVEASSYPLHVVVHGVDRPGLLSDVAHAVADMRINILSARACSRRDGIGTIDMVIEVRSVEQFAELRRRLERVRDVLSVERVGGRAG